MRQYVGTLKFGPENRVSDKGRPYSSIAVSVEGEPTLARVFGPPDFAGFAGLEPGVTVPLAKDSAGRWHLLQPGDQQQPQAAPLGFQPSAPAAVPAPTVQQQQAPQYGAPPAAPAAPADPLLRLCDDWARAYRRLIELGVPEALAGGAASTAVIQAHRR